MKHIITLFFLFVFITPTFSQEEAPEAKQETAVKTSTFYFIRHAEKDRSDKTNKDPHLVQSGLMRSIKWSYALANVKFDAVYSTDYNRTRETAQPTAEKNGLELTIYDPKAIDGKAFMEANRGMTVLVVGHSNTTPTFVNAVLGKEKYAQIDDSNNANLYIVTITGSGEITDVLVVVD